MEKTNWESFGITWKTEVVSKQHGPNKTDRVAYTTKAQIPTVADEAAWDKFVAHFGKGGVLALFTASNSIRVRAQAVCRSAIEEGERDEEKLRQRVYNNMKGIRAQASVVVNTVYVNRLPDGTMYEGTDELEFQQAYAAAMVDMGVPADTATAMAGLQKLVK